MNRSPKLDRDIRPVSEFRANAADLIEHVRTSRRPLDVRTAVEQIEAGRGVSNRVAKAELRRRFGR